MIALNNFADAGISEHVELFVGDTKELALTARLPDKIDFLMLDADGRIDRDLQYLYSSLNPGCPVIIDDVDDQVFLGESCDGEYYIDNKHIITAKLLSTYVDGGYLLLEERIGNTAFCRRGTRSLDLNDFNHRSLDCYRELVFTAVSGKRWDEIFDFHKHSSEYKRALRLVNAIPDWLVRLGAIAKKLGLIEL